MDLEESVAAVAGALRADPRIGAALLFGSAAKGLARASSDLDIGLIARSPGALAGLRAGELELAAALSLAAGREVHMVLLEHAEPVLGRQAFLGGRVLFDHNPARTADVLERILIAYFDGEIYRRIREQALERRRDARRG